MGRLFIRAVGKMKVLFMVNGRQEKSFLKVNDGMETYTGH